MGENSEAKPVLASLPSINELSTPTLKLLSGMRSGKVKLPQQPDGTVRLVFRPLVYDPSGKVPGKGKGKRVPRQDRFLPYVGTFRADVHGDTERERAELVARLLEGVRVLVEGYEREAASARLGGDG